MFLIYNDTGVSSESVQALIDFLSPIDTVQCVLGSDIQTDRLLSKATCFIMPGGRSLPFYEKCGQRGNEAIIRFVQNGGRYLGLCAGAYYAAQKTVFAQGLPLELILPGKLNFFKGRAIGPAFSATEFAYQTENGALSVDIILKNGSKQAVYFNGGCYFENAERVKNTEVLAHYAATQQPAIIACSVGRGMAVLSGVHPELSAHSDVLLALFFSRRQ